jgi:hypothetical protein
MAPSPGMDSVDLIEVQRSTNIGARRHSFFAVLPPDSIEFLEFYPKTSWETLYDNLMNISSQ